MLFFFGICCVRAQRAQRGVVVQFMVSEMAVLLAAVVYCYQLAARSLLHLTVIVVPASCYVPFSVVHLLNFQTSEVV